MSQVLTNDRNVIGIKTTYSYLDIRADIFGDVGTIALRQNGDFLLNIFDFILGLFKIDNFDGNNLLGPPVYALIDLAE